MVLLQCLYRKYLHYNSRCSPFLCFGSLATFCSNMTYRGTSSARCWLRVYVSYRYFVMKSNCVLTIASDESFPVLNEMRPVSMFIVGMVSEHLRLMIGHQDMHESPPG